MTTRQALQPLLDGIRAGLASREPGPDAFRTIESALSSFDASAVEAGLARQVARVPQDGGWLGLDLLDLPQGHASLFLLAPGGAIPPHDHPGMTVLTRVLLGRARVRAWDWLDAAPAPGEAAGARLALDAELDATSPVLWTRPDSMNIHAIEALAPLAFVDVLVPWYSPDRRCSYYAALPGALRREAR